MRYIVPYRHPGEVKFTKYMSVYAMSEGEAQEIARGQLPSSVVVGNPRPQPINDLLKPTENKRLDL